MVGAYFQHQRNLLDEEQPTPGIQQYIEETGFTPTNPDGITSDSVFNNYRTQNFLDRAMFDEVTWHLTHAWQVTGGTRFFWQQFNIDFLQTTPYRGSVCGSGPLGETAVSRSSLTARHISKLNTSYNLSPETKLYFTYAEGFRRGGADGVPLAGNFASLPIYLTYVPDIAKNYEVGIKGSLADQRLRYTADVFWINLQNFQFNSYTPAIENAVFNGDRARSKGVEFEIEAKPTQRAEAQIAYTYTEATVTNAVMLYDLPPFSTPGTPPVLNISIPAGTRLPGVPTQSVTLGGNYRMPLPNIAASGWTLTWHGDFAYAIEPRRTPRAFHCPDGRSIRSRP